MIELLKYWRDLTKEQKEELRQKYNIKAVTFHDIERIYETENKPKN